MTNFRNKGIPVPEQREGGHKDFEASVEIGSLEAAKHFFDAAKSRLLDVNNWSKLCGKASAEFFLTDENGQKVEGRPEAGFHLKIDVPGPGSAAGEGFDWVEVEAIEEGRDERDNSEYILMRVRPSDNPGTGDKKVAHFFSEKSTSNFLVIRNNKIITAAVLGRNETVNKEKNICFFDKLRNAVTGIAAALGFSNPQWNSLVNGLLDKK